ncbi:alanine:cation symporter family protein [Rummeliibacillus stabekisii]|uniref:alanine/glycine:cation symporter family protein n=1 Tax=Rummeliibacillus stabekisii TaxID=241244 RepID=UPI00203B4306|nr:alanine/glycine:cation symporter family protein [Rummeliibacillus stabekisii]MCM3317060.1 alanine:cation symporter family protein [Rummeliibacillus stabekisii]
MGDFVAAINDILWGPWMIYGILVVGLVFSIIMKFPQVRFIKDMVLLMFKGEKSEKGISSFQALSIALSGRVGTGNIAGTATAIAFGGPGAVFWMWMIAFIGAATAYVESTLAQIYKEERDDQYRGGPAYYIEKGTGKKWAGIIFAIAALMAMAVLMPGVQTNAISDAMHNAFGVSQWITGLIVTVLLAVIVIGGVKAIATVAQYVVPFMAILYMIMAVVIISMHIGEIPHVLKLIFENAFGFDSAFGGMLGAAIAWGVKRGVFSNEAGQGTGAHAAAAAEVSHPAKQGLVQAASVYIDTLLVCSATAFMVLFSGTFNVFDEAKKKFIFLGDFGSGTIADQVSAGSAYTQFAVDQSFPGFGSGFVAIALFFFAFTTTMAYYYIAETNIAYLFKGKTQVIAMWITRIVYLAANFYGSYKASTLAWALGDVGLGLMVWINVIGILIVAKPAIRALKDYERQKKEGKDPVFDPTPLGIKDADFWVEYNKEKNAKDNKKRDAI